MKWKLATLAILIVLIKIYLSLRFSTPFVFGDEYLYSSYAKDILLNPFYIVDPTYRQIYPPGYPLLLTPNFILFYPNMEMVYRSILVTNAILSTSILLTSYLILKNFAPKNLAVYGSVLVTLLPINTLYNFMILSENIYIPLYLLSGYLILKSFEKDNKLIHIFTGFVIFYLTITRAFGILAYASFFILVLYKAFTEKNHIFDFLKKNRLLIGVPIVLFGAWNLLKRTQGSGLYEYDSSGYLQSILYIFNDFQNLTLFLKLIINEIDYLMFASYFIFFVLSMLIFLYWDRLDQPVKTYVLYSFVYTVLSIILTVLHKISYFRNPGDSSYVYYFIYGRYIDPVLPTIFIMGLISWNKFILSTNKDFKYDNIIKKIIFISIFAILIFVITYPYDALYRTMNDRAVNIMSLYYTKDIGIFIYMLPIIFLILCFMSYKRPKILIIVLTVFSLLICIPMYEWIKMGSNSAESTNNIGRFLKTVKNESILIDQKSFDDYYSRSHSLIRFWAMPNRLIYESNISNITSDISYIISREHIPYNLILTSSDKIMLYRNYIINDTQIVQTTGFYNIKYNTDVEKSERETNYINNTWKEDNVAIRVYVPSDNMPNKSLIFDIEGN